MELPALGRMDRVCFRSLFLGSCVLAFVLLAVRMKICRCAYKGNAARTGPALHNLHCLPQGLGQGVPPLCLARPEKVPVTQDVNSNVLWWSEEPEEVVLSH